MATGRRGGQRPARRASRDSLVLLLQLVSYTESTRSARAGRLTCAQPTLECALAATRDKSLERWLPQDRPAPLAARGRSRRPRTRGPRATGSRASAAARARKSAASQRRSTTTRPRRSSSSQLPQCWRVQWRAGEASRALVVCR